MGTVLSFSPRERRPIYTTHHHGSGTISTSNSTSDFQLNNYAYEQINNAKNRENSKPMQYLTVPNQFQNGQNVLFGSSNSTVEERQADSARILSEKNAIEKNLKKHSLFINALSWKRLSSSHGKKKLESNSVKNKSGITTSTFRPPALTDVVHPMVVVNDKKKYPQQQIQLVANNNKNNNHQPIQQPLQNQTIFYAPGDPKSLLALDLERAANNANNLHHHVDKVATKMSLPLRPVQLTQPAPRKTIIQVSFN
jgi:cyclin-dependent kinase 5 activator 1